MASPDRFRPTQALLPNLSKTHTSAHFDGIEIRQSSRRRRQGLDGLHQRIGGVGLQIYVRSKSNY